MAFVVVGGGIAGVSCVETLSYLHPEEQIILITESPLVKAVTNFKMLTKTLSRFDVIEQEANELTCTHSNLNVIKGSLAFINSKDSTVSIKGGRSIQYKYLCICTGGEPKIIPQGKDSPYVLGLRDTDSVDVLIEKIGQSKRIALIGNGGIATELIYKLENVHIDWIVKDKHITATFVDPGAAQFFQASLNSTPTTPKNFETRMRYKQDSASGSGAALGPDWYKNLHITGLSSTPRTLDIHYNCEVATITPKANEVEVLLTNGKTITCDLIISATGVLPRINFETDLDLELSSDNGIKIDDHMRTSLVNVYAAGDVCIPTWAYAEHWFPMRLWSQARQMGCYAAKCMSSAYTGQEIMQDFCFELFAHSTKLFGYEVILLGLYNGQKLGTDYECLIRTTPQMEFIKFVIKNHRLQGAILIGNTDLAETCENLILNQLDLEPYGDDILNPNIDIEDYFD